MRYMMRAPSICRKESKMARKAAPPPPQPASLTVEAKRGAIPRFQKRIEELKAFDVSSVRQWSAPEVTKLSHAIDKTLTDVFGPDTVEYNRYSDIKHLGRMRSTHDELHDYVQYLREDIAEAVAVLEGVISGFQEDIEHAGPETSSHPSPREAPRAPNKKVFVVHGHDEAARETVARFLVALGLQPIILHEQVSQSRTVIEKIEANSDVGFAVVLLTGDDVGGKSASELKPRARQNVIFELGYFIGHLKRARVCALKRGDVEVLSDFSGVVYTEFDAKGGWKMELAKEIRAAGIAINAEAVLA